MQPIVATSMTKCVALAGGLWGLRHIHITQERFQSSTAKDHDTFLSTPVAPLVPLFLANKEIGELKAQVKFHYKKALVSLSNHLEPTYQSVQDVVGAIRFDHSRVVHLLLSPHLTSCDEQPRIQISTNMLLSTKETRVENENTEIEVEGDSKSAALDTTGKVSTNSNITVVLYDSITANDNFVMRGSHIVFSWSIFATVWSSVLAFPVYTVCQVCGGAWSTVASILTAWACSLFVRLPSCHDLRRFVFSGLHKWFPRVDIVYEGEPAVDKTIFCAHPHGVFSIGTAMLLDDLNYRKLENGKTREVVIVAAPFLRWGNPVFKCIADLMGIHIHGAGRTDFRKLLESGTSCALVPGGFSEATITCVGKERVYINERKGFIKYALRAGYSLTPVYVFGESDLYHNPQGFMEERLHLNTYKFQIPGVLPFGYPLAPLAPRRVPIRVVCGSALQLPIIENPTDEDIDRYHAQYVAALEALFYRHVDSYHADVKSRYGDEVELHARVLERW
jgi:hypothetical protein